MNEKRVAGRNVAIILSAGAKSASLILPFLLVTSALVLAFNVQLVRASGTIYIRADGSIDPPTAPIYTADNITYTLTGNITADVDGIVIKEDNIVLNGAGYTVTGSWSGIGNGITLTNSSNVTVRNMAITKFLYGIDISYSSNNVLSGSNVTVNEFGIEVESSSNNTLSGDNVTANGGIGIGFDSSSGNALSGNNIANNGRAIWLNSSSNNTLSDNIIADNWYGIWLDSSSNNTLSGNNVTANYNYGIQLDFSSGNALSGNNALNNDNGMTLYSSSANTLSGNVMAGNGYNFFVSGYALSDFLQSVDTSNLVDGKPVYYFVNQSDIVVNADAYPEIGYLGVVNCVNVNVQGLNLTKNGQGLLLANTNDSKITGNNAANNWDGIYLWQSSDNALTGNNVTANIQSGIYLGSYSDDNTLSGNNVTSNGDGIELRNSSGGNTLSGSNVANNGFGIYLDSSGNFIFDNSFVGNTYPVYTGGSADIWNNGSRGNYWSDYLTKCPNATEVGSSGVWNTPYVIDTSNIDHYPLVNVAMVPEFPSPFILLMCALACFALIMASRRKHLKAAE